MDEYDGAYARLRPVIGGLCRGLLLMKRIELSGEGNFVRTGGNIIVANHIGSYKDIAVLFRVVPRRIFFMANARIFSRVAFQDLIRRHFLRHMKEFGAGLDLALSPLKRWFVRTISDNIAALGTIPVDLDRRKGQTFGLCREYILKERAIIALQGMGFVPSENGHPYVPAFRPGPAALAYALYEQEGLEVPVTPMAIFGTHHAWGVPTPIRINIGEPMFVSGDPRGDRAEAIRRFRERLETRVRQLLMDSLRNGRHG
jgi:1-acyl-sn-glycerol-3-phosphate acyltransferase